MGLRVDWSFGAAGSTVGLPVALPAEVPRGGVGLRVDWSFGAAGITVGLPVALPAEVPRGAVGLRVDWSFGAAGGTVGLPVALTVEAPGDVMVLAGGVAAELAGTELNVGATAVVITDELMGLAAEIVGAVPDGLP